MATGSSPGAQPAQDANAFVITRVFDAPRDLVFKAWTEAERLRHWWGPKGFALLSCNIDLRPGGVFHYSLRTPDGTVIWAKWIFREIVAPERLTFVVAFSDEAGGTTRNPWSADWPLETLSALTLAEQDGRTMLTLRWTPLNAAEHERKTFEAGHDSMRQGWTGTLDKLTEYLAKA